MCSAFFFPSFQSPHPPLPDREACRCATPHVHKHEQHKMSCACFFVLLPVEPTTTLICEASDSSFWGSFQALMCLWRAAAGISKTSTDGQGQKGKRDVFREGSRNQGLFSTRGGLGLLMMSWLGWGMGGRWHTLLSSSAVLLLLITVNNNERIKQHRLILRSFGAAACHVCVCA